MSDNLSVIKVGPYFYPIRPMSEVMKGALEGVTDKKNTVIYLDTDLPHERREVVYWHELLHALLDLTGLGLEEGKEERLVDALAPALVSLFDDNAHIRWGWMDGRPPGDPYIPFGDDDPPPFRPTVIKGGVA